ncbi:long-chain fatty acid transport protein 2-like [Physella acuta]|uniref:long-chain fatty acid transport protein 2-like n=1 Tax=Physella acuta TaxID=109671 RepID=UPI0027DB0DBA|nr:long-chain fatty acid transport protein 2-like [Physella acuta]
MFDYDIISVSAASILFVLLLVRLIYPPLLRDLYTVWILIRQARSVKKTLKSRQFMIDIFESQVARRPSQPFIVFRDVKLTYEHVDKQAIRVARVLIDLGVRPGDNVALVMSNEPAFVWIYLGTQKIGACVSLVNHHLRAEGLRNSVLESYPKLVIVGEGFDEDLPDRLEKLDPPLELDIYAYTRPYQDKSSFCQLMEGVSDLPLPASHRSRVQLSDPSAFIFTSGTTGLPKPAIITHKKAILCSHSYAPVGFSQKEVMYLTLPLYHAAALNLALLNVIYVGATLVLKEKFSASEFWSDCCKHNVTAFQYIGEMLRYLVNTPHNPLEKQHHVTKAIGNGLRPDIWGRFQCRFRITHIYEFYGSTELPATCINLFNVPGSVGRLTPLLRWLTKSYLVKLDLETKTPYRNQEGRCELVQPGEPGVLLAKLTGLATFDGYLGPASETTRLMVKDVFEEGDFYVNTKDVFVLDVHYNLYFKDKIGDTFRWKGENVSTAEVSNILNTARFVQDTNVFGVPVPGCEGKAGMAAINLRDEEQLDKDKVHELSQLCRDKLPGYARPRFLRFQHQMSLTSTFKQQKSDLVKEGFDPRVVKEPLYYLDRVTDDYKPIDAKVFQEISKGQIAL